MVHVVLCDKRIKIILILRFVKISWIVVFGPMGEEWAEEVGAKWQGGAGTPMAERVCGTVPLKLSMIWKYASFTQLWGKHVNIDIQYYSMYSIVFCIHKYWAICLSSLCVTCQSYRHTITVQSHPPLPEYLSSMESFIPCIWKTQSEGIFANYCLGQLFFCSVCINFTVCLQLVILYN